MIDHNELKQAAKNLFDGLINKGFNNLTIHPYTDKMGNLIYAKARMKNQAGKKEIRPFYYDGSQWQPKEPAFQGGKKPLYRLHLLSDERETVWLFEGEQKADLMGNLGYAATTTGGSNTLNTHDFSPLIGKDCILWRDNDSAGKVWQNQLIAILCKLNQDNNKDPKLKIVNVDSLGLADKGDIIDYMAGLDSMKMQERLASLPMLDDAAFAQILTDIAKQNAPPASDSKGKSKDKKFHAMPAPSSDDWHFTAPMPFDATCTKVDAPYPIQAFKDGLQRGILKDVISEVVYFAQVPTALAAHSLLGVMAAIGQRLVDCWFMNEYKPVSLFLISEFPSGQGKSLVNRLTNRALDEWERDRYNRYLDVLKEWENLPPKERQNNAKPKNQDFFVTDGTIESVTDKFVLNEQKDIFWVCDEAAQFFKGYSMTADTASANASSLIKIWDGSAIRKTRSQRNKANAERTTAHDVRLTLDVMGQRVILQDVMNNDIFINQGFLPRALLICPQSFQGYRDYNSTERMNSNPRHSFVLNEFYAKCKEMLSDAPRERRQMPITKAAKQAIANYLQSVEIAQRPNGKYAHIPAFAARMAENAARIACLLALFDGAESMDDCHVNNAKLIVDYCINERLTYDEIADNVLSKEEQVLNWLIKEAKKKGQTIMGYSNVQSSITPHKFRNQAVIAPLEVLAEKEYIKIRYSDDGASRYIEIKKILLQ